MKVKELIHLLEKCDPEAQLVYDADNALSNNPEADDLVISSIRTAFDIDGVLEGYGTLKGKVYLYEILKD